MAIDPIETYVSIGVRSFGKGIFHYEPVLGDGLGRLRYFTVQPGDLIFSNIKAWEGAIAVATDREKGCVASNRFLTYVVDPEVADADYLRYLFLSEPGLSLIRRASPGSADRNRTLAIDRLERIEFSLPPFEGQRRVAERLGHLEIVAAGVTRLSQHASELSLALAASLTTRPDLGDEVKRRRGWRRVALGSVMEPSREKVAVELDGSYPNLGIYSYGRGLFAKPDIDGSETSTRVLNRVRAGQFIYSRLFAFEGAYGYVSDEFDGFFVSNEFPSFDTDPDQLNAKWLASHVRSPRHWAELGKSSRGLGVRRQRVPVDAVMAYEVWLPPIEYQATVVAAVDQISEVRSKRAESERRVGSLVPAALNEAFADVR